MFKKIHNQGKNFLNLNKINFNNPSNTLKLSVNNTSAM